LYGRQLARYEDVGVNLIVGNMEKLPFKDEAFDIVTRAVFLFYVPDLKAAVAEVRRVLVKNGFFIFSTCHPLVEGKLVRYRGKPAIAVRNYFKRRIVRWIDKLPDGSKVKMHSYYRTLQDYFDFLIENNFVIERYLELERLEENALSALDREEIEKNREARQLYRFMKEVPYWIILKTRKKA
jgi:ubiquinone/menaquinone biosynthesis C-methylase UbiE